MSAPEYRWSPAERLSEIRKLKDGWLDGDGKAFDPAGLDWVQGIFAVLSEAGIRRPYVYPTLDGHVQAEWNGDGVRPSDVDVRFDIHQHSAEVMVFDYIGSTVPSEVFQFDVPGGLEWFVLYLKRWA